MKQKDRRERTMQKLLETTRHLIEIKGCSKVTLNEIAEHSGYSKGAIFHYVSGKDELLAQVLEANLEEKNDDFESEVNQVGSQFEGPMHIITKGLYQLEDDNDVTNQILMYLLGKSDQPEAAKHVEKVYERAIEISKHWIVEGQTHQVISKEIDADKMADLFVLISFGFRTRTAATMKNSAFHISDFSSLIEELLKNK